MVLYTLMTLKSSRTKVLFQIGYLWKTILNHYLMEIEYNIGWYIEHV